LHCLLLTPRFDVILALGRRDTVACAGGGGLRELQKLQPVHQHRECVSKRHLLKSQPLPFVLIGLAMLGYVVIVWQWL
jgi:hypothetical protein